MRTNVNYSYDILRNVYSTQKQNSMVYKGIPEKHPYSLTFVSFQRVMLLIGKKDSLLLHLHFTDSKSSVEKTIFIQHLQTYPFALITK